MAEHHVAAVAIAVLLLWSLDWGSRALLGSLYRIASFVVYSVAILRVPYYSSRLSYADRILLLQMSANVLSAFICFGAAWLLSRWVYGEGPFRRLARYRTRFTRRTCA